VFERFTERARKVLTLAQNEAERLGHGHIGTEHLLLGLVYEGEGVAAQALVAAGVTPDAARKQVEIIVGYGETNTSQRTFTWDSKRTFEGSLREAMGLGHNYIGTEQLLLGLTNETEGAAVSVLRNLGVDPGALRREVVRRITGEETEPDLPGESGTQGEEQSQIFRGQVSGTQAEILHPDEENPARRVPVVVDLDYAYHVTRKGSDEFEPLNHAGLSDLVGRYLGARELSLPEAVVGLTGDLLLEEFPSIQEVTVTATLEDPPAPTFSVSATFLR
jgi:dihydroneopterin aldolase